ncbi:helix-turn-helix domain-containing protein [Microbacterium sp. BG28]|uniref:helix-turn-helix domain-containing protein n=1 Tax=Microbacterium sp. BG28 TaxID=3097356 RepID=UPI002A5AEE6A|nr:helix-turn-helix domain-containing protein [Microbacterium sp. BG28]MDY0827557.1 helix-turn-helix domain-containing protein [Microbacterium sp. BG28]
MESTDTYLAIGEVAAAFGVTVPTVRNWESAGKLRAIRTPGNQRRFAASQIEALLAGEPWEPAQ